ncbi:putative PRO2-gamma-glutamyl phosphate reductase [Jaminaea rosea]|uniref:glutamate-5-semialdehyde dehydrogenase n=1 Tax=Jaminaea rosea TaxID=1569628 RepID=A0A316UZ11_9BASI|nr:putative PRO2-gamma-glutamyl phosphate reductase [Jaminaea rosea]PWN30529.1 putative PRO2-gamma-glutamyl phosphate reductase [Jaminaea rosea]
MASTSTSSSAENIARRAKTAFQEAQKRLPGGKEADAARARALEKIRAALEEAKDEIKQANEKDMEAANVLVQQGKLSTSLVSRLDLFSKPGKWASMLQGVSEVAALPTPLDVCTYAKRLADSDASRGALDLYRVTCPIGVLLCIFEARPEVIINIASLAIKSGNAAILKGGKESKMTAAVMSRVVAQALAQTELPADVIQTVETREDVADLLHQDRYIDLVIPRGSNELVRSIQREARMPVMGHADGLCLIYVHEDADTTAAVGSIVDAKIDYTAACNAVETLLLNEKLVEGKGKDAQLWPKLAEALLRKKVTLHCDQKSKAALEAAGLDRELASSIVDVKEEDYDTEFLDLDLAVKVVPGIDEAIDHINAHGSNHTDAIFTTSSSASDRFTRSLSSANVFVNCSTRFADGFRYGFGTEVGISTGRIHARGPVGLEGLVTYKYLAKAGKEGGVQAAGAFNGDGAREWSHRELEKGYPIF